MDEKCAACESELERRYLPMKEWNMKGPLCGGCYSKLIGEFYPGEHVRMGSRPGGGKTAGGGAGDRPGSPGAAEPPPGASGGGEGGDGDPSSSTSP